MCVCCIVPGPGLLRVLITVGQPGLKPYKTPKGVKGARNRGDGGRGDRKRDVPREVDHHRSRRRVWGRPGASGRRSRAHAA